MCADVAICLVRFSLSAFFVLFRYILMREDLVDAQVGITSGIHAVGL